MQMRTVESVVDGFHCETHGMTQNMVDQMPMNLRQNPVLMHQHRQQIRHQHSPVNRKQAKRVTRRQMVRDFHTNDRYIIFA